MVSAASYTNVTLKVHHVLNLGDGLEVVAILAADLRHPDDVVRVDMQQVRPRARDLYSNSRELELTNLLGLFLGCIEAKFCK